MIEDLNWGLILSRFPSLNQSGCDGFERVIYIFHLYFITIKKYKAYSSLTTDKSPYNKRRVVGSMV